ncbi:MAG: TrbI/VirB10 family protein [Brevundimonas sp.]|uniref:TrbI/VirB10 family protein n=1 Tax=Brevundimonas sp. TaxID=1871086 RepID=UPI00271A3F8C|nr:TrbI/VirB10 family protein [Brevundimonas sp.]MDO9077086.1 TrbI/VirB10 family protein [Brevundimonas sp.]MDP3080173.1 TrbI/VirB10 family protein [Brevundimonas sp.]MDZ4059767.1 TrbI/VirB10 family protein [Brevundimonas sp.]
MTDIDPHQSARPAISPKEPAPGLNTRAARPQAVRLRKSVVQAFVIGGAVLVSGSLAWAFVVQPELRDSARDKQAEAREDQARGVVRPAEAVTDQPASYDRLPEPRIGDRTQEAAATGATPTPEAGRTAGAYAPAYRPAPSSRARGPSPREQAARSGLFFADAGAEAAGSQPAAPAPGGFRSAAVNPDYGAIYNGHTLVAPLSPFELKAGAIVPAALLTAVDTSRAGPVIATVTQNVYDSVSGRHLLLPQGTRLVGTSEGESAYGDRRAFLTWERLILPNGKSLILTSEPGVDAQGAVGVRGQVDRRLWPLLVGTLFAGAITTLGQIARDDDGGGSGGLLGDAGDAAAIEGSQVGGRLVDRELEVRPTIRLRAGAPVRVMITRDLILEPYRP